MLHLVNLEEIEALLLQVPLVVKRFEDRDPEFFSAVKAWLVSIEDVFNKNRLPQASEVAACRASLISVERGFSDGDVAHGRMGLRKLRDGQANHMLKHAVNITKDTLRSRREQVNEAGSVMMQIVAVADHLGLIPPSEGENHTAYLQSIMLSISNRAELVSLLVHVSGLLGKADTLIVLDRSIASFMQ